MEETYYIDFIFDDHSYPDDAYFDLNEDREDLLNDLSDAISSVIDKYNEQHPEHKVKGHYYAYFNRDLRITIEDSEDAEDDV